LVHDLFRPEPKIFWTDFLVSLTIGYASAGMYLLSNHPALMGVGLVIAACALYRVSLFMHEIVHFRRREMRAFKITWNLLAGIPLLTPSWFYESHNAHHNTHQYGTDEDGEYLPLGNGALRDVLMFLSQVFVQPIVVLLRFLLAPLTFVHPRVRQWTLEHASSFVINIRYKRHIPADAPRKIWAAMDLACSARAWMIPIAVLTGLKPWTNVPKLYLLAISILTLNYVRTLAAHLYLNNGRRMSHEEQLLDSTTITGGWLLELMCPVGLRYHALHHLFPAMPYHNLHIAHRRLMEKLPEDAAYRRVVFPTYWSVLRHLFRSIREAKSKPAVKAQQTA
jgi:fatty acid desaturase